MRPSQKHPLPAGEAGAADPRGPTPGWKPRPALTLLANPRTPAVPATLQITLDEYFAAAGAMGLIAAQGDEPDMNWVADWALKFGKTMAEKTRKGRR